MTLVVDARVVVGSMTIAIDVTVEPGETVALVGPNGAGKTSVVRAVAGLVRVAAGRIAHAGDTWDDGVTIFVPPDQRSVGVAFQQYLLFDHLSALENVAFGLRARGQPHRRALAAARTWLDRLGVAELAERRPGELSGGQQQRVAIARALATEPDVLLLDEPFAALDASVRAALRRDLAALPTAPVARLLVAHDAADVHALADRVVVLEAGRVTQRGTLADLAGAPRSSYVADLIGTNLLRGTLVNGSFRSDDGFELTVGAHEIPDGGVLAGIRPAAVALHRERPEGSPRNVWRAAIDGVDVTPDRVRVRLAVPEGLAVEVTPAGFAALSVAPGDAVWASVKASEISVVPD